MRQGKSAPESYDQMFKDYFDYVCKLVGKFGIDEENREDVASSILLRFYERDFLSKFDPSLEFTHQNTIYPAKFKTFLSGFVELYVRHHRDKQMRQRVRYPLLCDEEMESGVTWLEIFAPPLPDPYAPSESSLVGGDIVRAVRVKLSNNPVLLDFFEQVSAEVEETGKLRITHMQQRLRVSRRTISKRLAELREVIADVLSEYDVTLAEL